MKIKIITLVIILLSFTNCKNKDDIKKQDRGDIKFSFEKVVVVNLNEVCITYFKVKVENTKDSAIILMDNSLLEFRQKRLKPEKKGFYLRNAKNDSLVALGIDNNFFYEVGSKRSGYLFIAASNMKNSFEQKDSITFKKDLSDYLLEYNGKKLELNKIPKSKYISDTDYKKFEMSKDSFIPYKESISIKIPEKRLSVKYLNEMPITKEQWDDL